MSWTGNSYDLDPIENFSNVIKEEVRRKMPIMSIDLWDEMFYI